MKRTLFLFFILVNFLYAKDLPEILKDDKIRIAIINYPPDIQTLVNQRFTQLQKTIARIITKQLLKDESKAEYLPVDSRSDRMKALLDGKVDMLLTSLVITKDRSEIIDFSLPYFFINTALIKKKEFPRFSIQEAKNKKIALIPNTVAEKAAENLEFIKVDCYSPNQCMQMLENDEVDGYIDDDLTLFEYESKDKKYEISIKRIGKNDFFAIGVSKNSPILLDKINDILIRLSQDGFFEDQYKILFEPIYDGQTTSSKFLLSNIYDMQ